MNIMVPANKMHWWTRLYRKFFGITPGVYVHEEIKSLTGEQALKCINANLDGVQAAMGDEVNARILNRLFRLGVEPGPKIIRCESMEEILRVYNGE